MMGGFSFEDLLLCRGGFVDAAAEDFLAGFKSPGGETDLRGGETDLGLSGVRLLLRDDDE